MQPEKAGVWAYPYPVSLSDAHRDIPLDEKYFESSADGEQTIFNMVNGMCASLYLSGRIDYCNEYNKALVHEGVETYKSIRGFIKRAYPIFPLGQLKINKRGFLSLGLVSEEDGEILLAVWKINAKESEIEIDLSSRLSASARIQMLYPAADTKVDFSLNAGKLKLRFPEDKQYMARLLKIKLS
jgi:alpha-galactosidase